MVCDGLYDIHQQLALSGEPLIPQLAESFKQFSPRELLDMHRLTLEGLAEEIKFNDYWNSTAHDDGQVVDAVIMPCAPSASLVPGKYRHLGTMTPPLTCTLFFMLISSRLHSSHQPPGLQRRRCPHNQGQQGH